jgi:hypothetical protein
MNKIFCFYGLLSFLFLWSGCEKQPPVDGGNEVETQPVPDLQTLFSFKGYRVEITEISGSAADSAKREITGTAQFQALFEELAQQKGYVFSPNFGNAKFFNVGIARDTLDAQLLIGTFPSSIKEADGTMAAIGVVLDREAPDRSIFQGHLTNVYGLQPQEMPKNSPPIIFNNEPWFTVQVCQAVPVASQIRIIWYRYWWFDSHHHKNWWYGCYNWYWWWWQWHQKPWWWWHNWWWGWYHWYYWYSWSTLWPYSLDAPTVDAH